MKRLRSIDVYTRIEYDMQSDVSRWNSSNIPTAQIWGENNTLYEGARYQNPSIFTSCVSERGTPKVLTPL
jgi:hypothetical protein